MDTIIPIGIYRYFDLTVFLKVAKFLLVKTKRNKRYLICPKPTLGKTFAKRFSQDIFPSSVGIDCKGTTKFADVQILSRKSFRSFKSFKGDRMVFVEK